MSLRAGADWRGGLLWLVSLVCGAAALWLPALPQPQDYHDFADDRTLIGVDNSLNVLSNLPFLVAGLWGLALILRGAGQFASRRERLPYLVFFLGATLTCLGSSYYHLAPDNARLVWDRLPMTLGFSGLLAAAFSERVRQDWGERALAPLLALGVFTVIYWHWTERQGAGNVLPYVIFQGWAVLLIVVLLAVYPARRFSHGHLLAWAAVWYALAKMTETFDDAIFARLGGVLSGHSLKHVLAALGIFAIVWQLRLRQPLRPG